MNMSLDTIVKALGEDKMSPHNNFIHTKELFGEEWELLIEKVASP